MTGPGLALIGRAVTVLDAFTRGPGTTLSLGELARRAGLPKTTVHRLLAALQAQGLIERAGTGYQLGMRLFELGEHVPRKVRLREAALPFLQDLFEASHDTVHLAVLDGDEVVYLDRIRGHRRSTVASRVGGRQPAYCTGVGKAMLAFDAEAATAVLVKPLRPRTPYTITNPHLLLADLERVRATGIALDREEHTVGIACIAAPVLIDGRALAAVSVTSMQLDVDRYATAVRAAALGIRRAVVGRATNER